MNWNPIDSPVSFFILSGMRSPGVCQQPKGAAVVRNLDEKRGYGIDLPYVVFVGRNLAKFSTEITLVTRKDWEDWDKFSALIHEVPRRGPVDVQTGAYRPGVAHTIWHPQLVPLRITQCIVERESQVEIDVEMGVGKVLIEFRQVVSGPPKQAVARPEAAKPPAPLTADALEIQRMTGVLASKRQRNAMAESGRTNWVER